jgi:phosphohistidine phosphatase
VRTLILLRHAAAESQGLDARDYDRALTPAGRAEAAAAAQRLAALPTRPLLLLTSPAVRTRATAEIVARHLGLGRAAVRDDDSLYLAAAPVLRAAIARIDASVGCLLVVGHNPGLSELASMLDADRGGIALATGCFVHFALPLADWTLP